MQIRYGRQCWIVMGPCGVGKTTYACRQLVDCLLIDRERLSAAIAPPKLQTRCFDPPMRSMSRLLQIAAAHQVMERGLLCCITCGGATRHERAIWVNMAKQYGYQVHGILLIASQEVCTQQAMQDRNRPKTSRGKWRAIIRHWFERFEPILPEEEGFFSFREIRQEPSQERRETGQPDGTLQDRRRSERGAIIR